MPAVEPRRHAYRRRVRHFATAHRLPLTFFPAMFAVLVVTQHVSNHALRDPHYSLRSLSLRTLVDGWVQYDGHSYLDIATNGYSYTPDAESNIVWFPLYPLILRLGALFTDPMFVGVAVTALAGFVGALLWWRWLGTHGVDGPAKPVAFLTMMLYPYAWFLYGPVYSDALFWALVLGAFLLLEADRPLAAGLVGAMASATRSIGVAVVVALVVASCERHRVLTVPPDARGWIARWRVPVAVHRRRVSTAALLPATSAAGIAAFALYQWVTFGDPLAFVHNQAHYHPGRLPLLKLGFFAAWRDAGPDFRLPLTLTAQGLFAAVVAFTTPAVGRRFGWGYAVLVGLVVAIPTVTTNQFMGTGRYLLAAFPTAALVGEWLAERRWWRAAWLTISAVSIVGLNMAFARSWYLS